MIFFLYRWVFPAQHKNIFSLNSLSPSPRLLSELNNTKAVTEKERIENGRESGVDEGREGLEKGRGRGQEREVE